MTDGHVNSNKPKSSKKGVNCVGPFRFHASFASKNGKALEARRAGGNLAWRFAPEFTWWRSWKGNDVRSSFGTGVFGFGAAAGGERGRLG